MARNSGLMVAGLFGMIILIIMFVFGGMFIASIVSGIDETAVAGTELENVSETIQPLGQGLTNIIPVFIWVCVVGLLAIGLIALYKSRAK